MRMVSTTAVRMTLPAVRHCRTVGFPDPVPGVQAEDVMVVAADRARRA